MVGRHHWLYGHGFEQALGVGDGREAWCAASTGSQSRTRLSDWTERVVSAASYACTRRPPWTSFYQQPRPCTRLHGDDLRCCFCRRQLVWDPAAHCIGFLGSLQQNITVRGTYRTETRYLTGWRPNVWEPEARWVDPLWGSERVCSSLSPSFQGFAGGPSCALTVSASTCSLPSCRQRSPRVRVSVQSTPFYKDVSRVRLSPTLVTSF